MKFSGEIFFNFHEFPDSFRVLFDFICFVDTRFRGHLFLFWLTKLNLTFFVVLLTKSLRGIFGIGVE